jgi:peroxiredoxin (alkyl hydroperoxide reductase subunit C)
MYEYKRNSGKEAKSLGLGKPAPSFESDSNYGTIKLDDYKGKWVIFLSHPTDFSPTWVNEIEKFAHSYCELRNLNCDIIGIAPENNHSLLMWPKAVQEQYGEKIWFPVIFDSHHQIARSLGMINQEDEAAGLNRSICVIDDRQVLRSIVYYDPANPDTMKEVIRLVKLLQKSNACGIVTPDSWRPGDEWILTPPPTENKTRKKQREMWYF